MILDQAYKFSAGAYLMKPYPSIKRFKFTLQDLGHSKPGITELNPLRFADMNLLRELEASGFIDHMYGNKP